MDVAINNKWKTLLVDEFSKQYFLDLIKFLNQEIKTQDIYPKQKMIFNAFNQCSLQDIKVVIIGQDPYHGINQANGLSFSVNDGVKLPPSLRNIYKELKTDIGGEIPSSGNLEHWAQQGVLLLNATLTVRSKQPGSHQKKGWENFTNRVIQAISEQKEHIVFILWGAYAQKKGIIINEDKHLVIKSPHPSPFSAHRGFFGSKPFSKTNAYLLSIGLTKIDW